MAVKAQWHRCSVRGLLRHGERGKEAGRGAVKLGGGARLLQGAGGAPGRKYRWVMAGDLQPTPLMAGEVVNANSRGGIKAGE
jgi:hypothetical protein